MLVAVIDYGMGNILSVKNALEYLGADVILTSDEEEIRSSDKIVLPGVGSFRLAMQYLKEKKLDTILEKIVIEEKKDILGICLGMQLFASSSDEDGFTEGLGWIDANVKHMTNKVNGKFKIPHIGFDSINKVNSSTLFKDIEDLSDFYFVHSFSLENIEDKKITATYKINSENIVASIEYKNIYGVQFHPEKSQDNGLLLLKNFLMEV